MSPSDGVATSAIASFARQTLRQQAFPDIAGAGVRIHLSNRFGARSVTFDDVTIGGGGPGASIAAGTLRTVTFGGHGTVTIPAHADVVSDPVMLAVTPFERLLVSTYLAAPGGLATEHFTAEQTTYLTLPLAGDHAHDTSGGAFVLHTPAGVGYPQAVYYLSGLDVLTNASTTAVAAFGDSITDGFQGTALPEVPSLAPVDRNGRWPNDLARRLAANGTPLSVVDDGISGNQLLKTGLPIFGVGGLQRFTADALSQPGVTTIIMLEGINDIGTSSATAVQLIAGYTKAIALAHDAGKRILLGTLTPADGYYQPTYNVLGDPVRQAVNEWIRTQHLSDGIVDFDRAVRDPADLNRIDPRYDDGDHLHFNLAGYQQMANAVPLDLLSDPTC